MDKCKFDTIDFLIRGVALVIIFILVIPQKIYA